MFIRNAARLAQWVTIVHDNFKLTFSQDGELPPMLLTMHACGWPIDDGGPAERVVLLSLADLDDDKETARNLARVMAAAIGVDSCCLVADTWVLGTSDPAVVEAYMAGGQSLSEHPSRVEALMTMGYARGMPPTGICSRYRRLSNGLPRDFEDMSMTDGELGGAMHEQLALLVEPLPEPLPEYVRWASIELLKRAALAVTDPTII